MKRVGVLLGLLLVLCGGRARAEEEGVEAWLPVDSPTQKNLEGIAFQAKDEGWAVGERGTVLRYDGRSWRAVPGPEESGALSMVTPVGPEDFWTLVGGTNRLYRYQRGRWTRFVLDGDAVILSMAFHGPELGYAVGLFGVVYRWDGRRWERVESPALARDRESHLDGVVLLAPDNVWVGSQSHFVLHFDGREWRRVSPGSGTEGSPLRPWNGTALLVGTPMRVLREGRWEVLATTGGLLAVAGREGRLFGIPPTRELVQVTPTGRVPVLGARGLMGLAGWEDELWAVGARGTLLRLERVRLPTFVDRTFEAGVGVLSASQAARVAQLDDSAGENLVLFAPFGRSSFLRSEEGGGFRAQPLVTPTSPPETGDLALVDLDGDGRLDMLVRPPAVAGRPALHLLRNLGGWRFHPAPSEAPPLAPEEVSQQEGGLDVADLDGDGDLDVYESRFLHAPDGVPLPDVLWVNDGVGRLRPRVLGHHDGGAALAWSQHTLLADLDGDGRVDRLSVNAWGEGNLLYRQEAGGRLAEVRGSGLAGVAQEGLAAAAGDIDGDGDLDVLNVANANFGPSRLYRNEGQGRFRDITSEAGLDLLVAEAALGNRVCADFADLDNDGDVDLVLGPARFLGAPQEWVERSLRVLLNDGAGHFTDVTSRLGLTLSMQDGVVEDLDGDGDIDLYLVRLDEANRLFANETAHGHWLKVRPEGLPPNRAALGARVRVYGTGGALLSMRETSWRHPVAHLGLGRAQVVDVEVRFPSGRVEWRRGVGAGRTVEVAEAGLAEQAVVGAAFFLRHRLAWTDLPREALKLALALGAVLALCVAAPRLGARRLLRRGGTVAALLAAHVVLAVALAPWVPVSPLADGLPSGLTVVVGGALLAVDRARTRREEARFVGPYELLDVIGQGGMGTVYRARDTTRPGRPMVALKVLRPDSAADPQRLQRFAREAEIGARLHHPGIVTVLASGECRVPDGRAWRRTVYIAMERVEGASLGQMLAAGERLPLERAVEIVRDAAEALGAAHALGVLHRDVKPDNLLLTRAGVVKLVDFGIASLGRSSGLTEAGLLVGTLGYLPPERAEGRPEDARSDLYSLGVVLYELACGARPFPGEDARAVLSALLASPPRPPRELNPALPERLEALLLALLEKRPEARPGSAEAVVAALDEALHALRGRPLARAAPPPELRLEVTAPAAPRAPSEAPVERLTLDLPPPEAPSE